MVSPPKNTSSLGTTKGFRQPLGTADFFHFFGFIPRGNSWNNFFYSRRRVQYPDALRRMKG
ncbi:MAG: hypothetical protein MJ159_06550, partial [Treponemataceae bacterium]|nr:hypothetical protein [Treponemataceae bacterium]